MTAPRRAGTTGDGQRGSTNTSGRTLKWVGFYGDGQGHLANQEAAGAFPALRRVPGELPRLGRVAVSAPPVRRRPRAPGTSAAAALPGRATRPAPRTMALSAEAESGIYRSLRAASGAAAHLVSLALPVSVAVVARPGSSKSGAGGLGEALGVGRPPRADVCTPPCLELRPGPGAFALPPPRSRSQRSGPAWDRQQPRRRASCDSVTAAPGLVSSHHGESRTRPGRQSQRWLRLAQSVH